MSDEPGSNPSRPHSHPGLFLALEGPDGGGKSTQAARLATWLRVQGLDVVSCRDPGSTELGNRLRQLVMGRDSIHLGLRAEMLLYMASRAQLADEVIRPALEAGRVLITDRFLLSNVIYQGFAGGLSMEDLWRIGQVVTGGLLPDLTLILDVPTETARDRVGPARDRIEDRTDGYHQRVREGYLASVRAQAEAGSCPYYPAPLVLIDATGDPDAVFALIQNEVERVLALGPRG
jgi:dTMP kinase